MSRPPLTPEEANAIGRHVAKSGAFMAATCPACGCTKRPYRDVSEDDGKACEPCVKDGAACPGCNKGGHPVTGNWHDEAGRWHRACAIAANRCKPGECYAPMVLRTKP